MTRTCGKCGESKPLREFRRDVSHKDGLRECKACAQQYSRQLYAENVERHRARSRAYYERNSEKILAWQRAYNQAHPERPREYHRAYYQLTSEHQRNRYLFRQYGISVEGYESMLLAQGGGCAICGGLSRDGRRLAVDHDHESGEVRALLCASCNTAIGLFNEDPELMRMAVEYVENGRACTTTVLKLAQS